MLILLRRIIAVILAILFLALFVAAVVLSTVNGTFLSPSFYTDQLRKGDIYNFLYDDLLPTALEDAAKEGSLPIGIDVTVVKDEAVSIMREVLPPEWLQEQVEQVIKATLPYATGDREQLTINIPLKDRVEATGTAAKDVLHTGDSFSKVYDELTVKAADEAAANLKELPLGLTLGKEDILDAMTTIASEEWLLETADHVIDQVVLYLTGKSEHFAVVIPLDKRARVAADVIKKQIRKGDIYDFVFQEMVTPVIEESLGQVTSLPFGVAITRDEVLVVSAKIVSREWVNSQLDGIIDRAVPYLTGASDTLELRISFADRKEVAVKELEVLADSKLQALLASLPQCTLEQVRSGSLLRNGVPVCQPPGVSYQQAKELLKIDVTQGVRQSVVQLIPNDLVYDENDLRQALGPDALDQMDKVRDWLSNGLTYTDADLRDDLGQDDEKLLDDVLDATRNGFTFNEQDVRNLFDTESDFAEFDRARNDFGTVRSLFFLVWLAPLFLLILIGLLGGRSWASKLTWAAVPLVIGAVLVVITTGPVYSSAIRPKVDDAIKIEAKDDSTALELMMSNKATDMAKNVIDDFVGSIRTRSIIFLVVGGVALGGGIGWQVRSKGKGKKPKAGTA